MSKVLMVLTAIFFLNSCSSPEPVYKYIDKPVPRLKILNKVKFFKVEDYKSFNNTYWLINKEEFKMASDMVIRKDYKIRFYEKQNILFNDKFATKRKKK